MIEKEAEGAEEIKPASVAMAIYRRRRFISIGTMLGLLSGLVLAYLLPVIYRAEVLLMPATAADSASGMGGYAGLASLAGLNVGGAPDKQIEAMATLESKALIASFIANNQLMPLLFYKRWDEARHAWKQGVDVPSTGDAVELFSRSVMHVFQDRETKLVTVTVDWREPKLAADWVTLLVAHANNTLKVKAIGRARQNLAFLERQLSETSVVEVRAAIFKLIESEVKNAMLAEAAPDYAFRVVDPAVVPDRKFKPKRFSIVMIACVTGLLIGCIWGFWARP